MGYDWTEEREKLLSKLWMDGLSCSQIANRFGNAITRNAVIGKVHRMRLPDRQSAIHKARGGKTRARNARKAKPPKQRPWEKKKPAPIKPVELYQPLGETIVVDPKNRRGVADLLPNQCRWPIGDPQEADFHFCDRDGVPGKSYCEHHLKVAFPPIVPKRSPLEFPVIQPDEELETLENA